MDIFFSHAGPEQVPQLEALARDADLAGALAFVRHYVAWQPGTFLLARDAAGTPVGCVGSQDYGRVSFVGAMCVARTAQRQGVGSRVLRRCMDEARGRGCTSFVLEATDAGAGLYARTGFRVDHLTHVWRRREPTVGTRTAFPALDTASAEALMALDEACWGAPRHHMLRPWLAMHAGRCAVLRDSAGRPTGYVVAGPDRIGPWVARNPEDAAELLRLALTLRFDAPPAVMSPEPAVHASRALEAAGFARVRTLRRMSAGEVPTGVTDSICGLATAGLG